MPQLEIFSHRDIEVLYFTDKIDEFMINNLGDYDDKKMVSITREDFDLDSIPNKENESKHDNTDSSDTESKKDDTEKSEKKDEHGDLLKAIQESLGEKVVDVRISKRLKSSPVCLVTTNTGTTFNMEQLLRGTNQVAPAARKILEVNPSHALFGALQSTFAKGSKSDAFNNCCDLIYYQALIIEGYELDNPVEFSGRIANLLVDAYAAPETVQ